MTPVERSIRHIQEERELLAKLEATMASVPQAMRQAQQATITLLKAELTKMEAALPGNDDGSPDQGGSHGGAD